MTSWNVHVYWLANELYLRQKSDISVLYCFPKIHGVSIWYHRRWHSLRPGPCWTKQSYQLIRANKNSFKREISPVLQFGYNKNNRIEKENFWKFKTSSDITARHFDLRFSITVKKCLLSSLLLHSTLLYSTLLYTTPLYSTLHYSSLLYLTLLYSTLIHYTLLYSTLLYSTWLHSTLLYFNLLYFTLLYTTLHHSTLLYSTLHDLTLFYSTLLYSSLLYSNVLLCTLLYSAIL